jgi:Fe-S oxidoreductase
VIDAVAHLTEIPSAIDKKKALCCGGSLANTALSEGSRRAVTVDAYNQLTASSPDVLATACPLCKKTFEGVSEGHSAVKDIAQIVVEAMVEKSPVPGKENSKNSSAHITA